MRRCAILIVFPCLLSLSSCTEKHFIIYESAIPNSIIKTIVNGKIVDVRFVQPNPIADMDDNFLKLALHANDSITFVCNNDKSCGLKLAENTEVVRVARIRTVAKKGMEWAGTILKKDSITRDGFFCIQL
jgi:hypothetical protein